MKIAWGEVVRRYKLPGLLVREERGLDPSIDVEGAEARARLEDLARGPALAADHERAEISLFADGERRHACLFDPKPKDAAGDPREAHVLVAAFRRGAADPADADRVELLVRWNEDGRPVVRSQRARPGRVSAQRSGLAGALPLRARLDGLRARPPVEAIAWVARGEGSRVRFRARPLLSALAELAPTLAPAQLAEVEALAASLEGGPRPGSAEPHLREPSWLPLFAGRKGSLARLADSLSCMRCGADHPGASIVERRFDTRTAGLWGEAGVVYECPKGHEILRVLEERT